MDLRAVEYDGRNWIILAQDRDRWLAYVRVAVNLRQNQSRTHRHDTTVHDVIRLLIPALYKNQSDSLMAVDGDCHHLCKLMAPVRHRWSISDVIVEIRNTRVLTTTDLILLQQVGLQLLPPPPPHHVILLQLPPPPPPPPNTTTSTLLPPAPPNTTSTLLPPAPPNTTTTLCHFVEEHAMVNMWTPQQKVQCVLLLAEGKSVTRIRHVLRTWTGASEDEDPLPGQRGHPI
ncbi:hypothetical protein ANN_11480 [Periplaneta americana]|uniref:Uncharacterized protein n=1 Tax=Periplaneta americana TaxID=6978 RepID=A0ABQ8T550_PERAM|nr:hypothetical protein ANN_11480 [Periplaneta americana]